MTISELIKILDEHKKIYGDIKVKVQTLSHVWEPELSIRSELAGDEGQKYVLLNS